MNGHSGAQIGGVAQADSPSSVAPAADPAGVTTPSSVPSPAAAAADGCELTIVLPCLNEAETLATCIRKATRSLRDARASSARWSSPTTGRPTARRTSREPRAPGRRRRPAARLRRRAARRHRGGARRVRAHGRRRRQLRPRRPRRLPRELRGGADLVMGNRFRGRHRAGRDAVRCTATSATRCCRCSAGCSSTSRSATSTAASAAFRRDRMLALGLRHVRHGVRQRDGGPGVAGGAARSARCRRRCAPTAARAPRTCAPGATAGGTCASCSRSARAGCCSTRPWLFQVVGLAGMLWLLLGPRSVGRGGVRRPHHAGLRDDVRARRAGARAGRDRPVVRGAPRAAARSRSGWTELLVRVSLERGLVLGGLLLVARRRGVSWWR